MENGPFMNDLPIKNGDFPVRQLLNDQFITLVTSGLTRSLSH